MTSRRQPNQRHRTRRRQCTTGIPQQHRDATDACGKCTIVAATAVHAHVVDRSRVAAHLLAQQAQRRFWRDGAAAALRPLLAASSEPAAAAGTALVKHGRRTDPGGG
jgi:hypothetical protein